MRIYAYKICLIILILVSFSFIAQAKSKICIKFRSKSLVQILDQYAKNGYVVLGPTEVTEVTHDYVKLFQMKEIKRNKKLKIIDQKGKKVTLHRGDRVYMIKKKRNVILIKVPEKKGYE